MPSLKSGIDSYFLLKCLKTSNKSAQNSSWRAYLQLFDIKTQIVLKVSFDVQFYLIQT